MIKPDCFQNIIILLQNFWSEVGCCLMQPYDMEVGAGTFHPATTLKSLGEKPWSAAYCQPSRRPSDGRYGENPNRLQQFFQFQVIMKPSPKSFQNLYLESLKKIGINTNLHDIRFVEDDWESPTLGAWGLGWEVWCDGMEISQFTYFQQMCGYDCKPISGEITYGIERLCMFILGVENVMNIPFNKPGERNSKTYGDIFKVPEEEYSRWNFDFADTKKLFDAFESAEMQCNEILNVPKFDVRTDKNIIMVQPAYDQCIKASHLFNLLDSRGVISVTERQSYILRVRSLAKKCADAFLQSEKIREDYVR